VMSARNGHPVVAVVDLGSDPATALLVVTVFLATFVLVVTIALLLTAKIKRGTQGTSTWTFKTGGRVRLTGDDLKAAFNYQRPASNGPLPPIHENQPNTPAEPEKTLTRLMQAILVVAVVALMVVTVGILVTMDASSRSQGGRIYVVAIAIMLLFALAKQFDKLAERRRPVWMTGPGEEQYRRTLNRTLAFTVLASTLLVGLAWLLP
jgi:hypothetical protein